MYIRFTYIDAQTNKIVNMGEVFNSLEFPKAKGLKHHWSAESEYPTNTPNFYGEADDSNAVGILEVLSKEDYEARYVAELNARRWQRVPMSISPRQARLVLLEEGKLDHVQAILDSLPEGEKEKAQIAWEWAISFVRTDPFVELLGQFLGYSSDKLDELFVRGAQL